MSKMRDRIYWEKRHVPVRTEPGNSSLRVSYNGITSAFQADDAGSIPATRSRYRGMLFWARLLLNLAHIAQSVEHFLGKEEVTGSNPVMSSNFKCVFSWLVIVVS